MMRFSHVYRLSEVNGTKFVGLTNAIAVGELQNVTINVDNIWRIRGKLLSLDGKQIAEGDCFVRHLEMDWIFVATENQCLET